MNRYEYRPLPDRLMCIGCGRGFRPKNHLQTRCRPDCSRKDKRVGEQKRTYVAPPTDFIGVDGEGITTDTGYHAYMLLSVGNESLHTGYRLTYKEIFPFLYEQQRKHPKAAFVGFYLKYDFTHWLRDLPEERARMLLSDEGRAKRARNRSGDNYTPFPVQFDGWEFDMLAMKRFKLRPIGTGEQFMYICDAGPFWQCSFVKAIDPASWTEPIVTPEEYAVILDGKQHRSDTVIDMGEWLNRNAKYNTLENDVLERVMGKLGEGFRKQQWKLQKTQWFGPGQAAVKWMGSINGLLNSTVQEITPRAVLRATQASYYGGWFEIPKHGLVQGESFEYDINSAYPHIISRLPCLLHGSWHRGTTYDQHAEWQVCYVRTSGGDPVFGGLPHRSADGKISRPHSTRGWYWSHEIAAAQRAGLIDTVECAEAWTYHPCPCLPPYRDIQTLYNERLAIGKNTPHGKALKLVYNSAYGKFAQSVGSPKYANPIYASLITAGCRAQILCAIATHPNRSTDVLMVATDGIYFRSRHPGLELSPNELGLWDEATKHNLTLFKPGVYWDDKARNNLETAPLKSRGINAHELAKHIKELDEQFAQWEPGNPWPTLDIPIRFSIITPNLALARNQWGTCGNIRTYDIHGETKRESADPSDKRDTSNTRRIDGIIVTDPYADKGETTPYKKTFGIMDDSTEAETTDEQPLQQQLYEMLGD